MARISCRPWFWSGSENRNPTPMTLAPLSRRMSSSSPITERGHGQRPTLVRLSSSTPTMTIWSDGLGLARSGTRTS
jgi:hypothetical protein